MADEIEVTVVIPETPVSEVAAIVEAIEVAPVEAITPTLIELALRIGAIEVRLEEASRTAQSAESIADTALIVAQIAETTAIEVEVEEEEEEEEEIEASEIPAIEEIPDSIEVAEAMPEIQERGARRSRFI